MGCGNIGGNGRMLLTWLLVSSTTVLFFVFVFYVDESKKKMLFSFSVQVKVL